MEQSEDKNISENLRNIQMACTKLDPKMTFFDMGSNLFYALRLLCLGKRDSPGDYSGNAHRGTR